MATVITVTRFRLRPGVDETEFRELDARYQTQFCYQQPGLLRRTVARSEDGEWLALDLWRSAADAEHALGRATADPIAVAYADHLVAESVTVDRYLELDG